MSIVGHLALIAAYPLRMVGYFSRTPETGVVAARISLYSTAEGARGTAERRATG